jgi:hypothetical protein
MVAACSPEMSDDFQQTVLRYIPEDTLHNDRCECLTSCIE